MIFVAICHEGVSSVPFPFRFPFQLHFELVSSLLALDATELVSQPLTQMALEVISNHLISVQQKRLHCRKKKRDFRIIRSKVGGLVTRSVGVYKFFV